MKKGMEIIRRILTILKTIILLLVTISCLNKEKQEILPVIDIENHIKSFETVKLTDIASRIDYVPLETNNNCLIGEIRNLIITDDRIFVIGLNSCRIFDRRGKFIGNAGS